jgi:ABC-type transport system substrate-binding protein
MNAVASAASGYESTRHPSTRLHPGRRHCPAIGAAILVKPGGHLRVLVAETLWPKDEPDARTGKRRSTVVISSRGLPGILIFLIFLISSQTIASLFAESSREWPTPGNRYKITAQGSDWNCGQMVTPYRQRKPFDDPRVRWALTLAIDRWGGAPELVKIANVRTVGGIVFPGSPLAGNKEELQNIAEYWPNIAKSRAEARRLLQGAGPKGSPLNWWTATSISHAKYDATWVIDQWSRIGLHVT